LIVIIGKFFASPSRSSRAVDDVFDGRMFENLDLLPPRHIFKFSNYIFSISTQILVDLTKNWWFSRRSQTFPWTENST